MVETLKKYATRGTGTSSRNRTMSVLTAVLVPIIILLGACSDTAETAGTYVAPETYPSTPSSGRAETGGTYVEPKTYPSTPSSGPSGHFLLQKVPPQGLWMNVSLQCYTIYPDGSVELRYNGSLNPDYYGRYNGDVSGGRIVWDSGHEPTTVELVNNDYKFDSVIAATAESCF